MGNKLNTGDDASINESFEDYISRIYGNFKSSNFGPNDSRIASSIRHPITAITNAGNWLNQRVQNASGVMPPEQLADNPNPLFGLSPEQQAGAGLDLAMLAGTGAMPFNRVGGAGTTGMFAGLNSATADKSKAWEAAKLLREGASKENAYAKTGWFQGPEQAWRYEIDDSTARMKRPMDDILESSLFGKPKGNYVLSDVLDHPELYKAYPELANVPFIKRQGFLDFGKLQGWRGENEIGLTPYVTDPIGTLLHEAQHYIQEKEGYGLGGNLDTALQSAPKNELKGIIKNVTDSLNAKSDKTQYLINGVSKYKDTPAAKAFADAKFLSNMYHNAYQEAKDSDPKAAADAFKLYEQSVSKTFELRNALSQELFGTIPERASNAERELLFQFNNPEDNLKNLMYKQSRLQKDITGIHTGDLGILKKHADIHSLYKRLAGETEARNVTDRRRLSKAERENKPSWETQEYPYSEQIISRGK